MIQMTHWISNIKNDVFAPSCDVVELNVFLFMERLWLKLKKAQNRDSGVQPRPHDSRTWFGGMAFRSVIEAAGFRVLHFKHLL